MLTGTYVTVLFYGAREFGHGRQTGNAGSAPARRPVAARRPADAPLRMVVGGALGLRAAPNSSASSAPTARLTRSPRTRPRARLQGMERRQQRGRLEIVRAPRSTRRSWLPLAFATLMGGQSTSRLRDARRPSRHRRAPSRSPATPARDRRWRITEVRSDSNSTVSGHALLLPVAFGRRATIASTTDPGARLLLGRHLRTGIGFEFRAPRRAGLPRLWGARSSPAEAARDDRGGEGPAARDGRALDRDRCVSFSAAGEDLPDGPPTCSSARRNRRLDPLELQQRACTSWAGHVRKTTSAPS